MLRKFCWVAVAALGIPLVVGVAGCRNEKQKPNTAGASADVVPMELVRSFRPRPEAVTPLKTVRGPLWTAQGPAPIRDGQVENVVPDNEKVGAFHTVVAHPRNPNVLYVGGANAGIWRTRNARALKPTWEPLTDRFPSLSIGALEMDPTDSDAETLVAGVGRISSYGRIGGALRGLLLSDDGGDTWEALPDPLLQEENISGVAVRDEVILASSNSLRGRIGRGGLYRSRDEGERFRRISGTRGLPDGDVFDLVGDRRRVRRFYASVSGAGIFQSNTMGRRWFNISAEDEGPGGIQDAVVNEDTNNIEMAVASNGRIYAAVMTSGQLGYLGYKDEGGPWTAMDIPITPEGEATPIVAVSNTTPIVVTSPGHGLFENQIFVEGVEGITGANGVFVANAIDDDNFELVGTAGNGAYTGGGQWGRVSGVHPRIKPGSQGSIHFSMVVDPENPNIVYIGGDRQDFPLPNFIGAENFTGRLFRGDTRVPPTGGILSPQWQHLTHRNDIAAIPGGGTASSSAPHADSREMVFDAGGDLIEVDDGGVYRRTSPSDNTGDWFSLNGNLQATEIHNIAYDNVSEVLISGNQDNGTTVQASAGNKAWDSFLGGDGGDVAVDDVSQAAEGISTRFTSAQFLGAFNRSFWDAANTFVGFEFARLEVLSGEFLIPLFTTPVELNTVDPSRLAIVGRSGTYISPDRGDTLFQIGPGSDFDLQNAMVYGGWGDAGPNPNVLYYGSENKVFVRTLEGESASPTATPYPGEFVRDIALAPRDWETVYVADLNRVYIGRNIGAEWYDITSNLPSSALRTLAVIEAGRYDLVLVGGLGGVFGKLTVGNRLDVDTPWVEIGTNLPEAIVYDLIYDVQAQLLVAGTLGRGAWTATLPSGAAAALAFPEPGASLLP